MVIVEQRCIELFYRFAIHHALVGESLVFESVAQLVVYVAHHLPKLDEALLQLGSLISVVQPGKELGE